jgi:hypothetical protein
LKRLTPQLSPHTLEAAAAPHSTLIDWGVAKDFFDESVYTAVPDEYGSVVNFKPVIRLFQINDGAGAGDDFPFSCIF